MRRTRLIFIDGVVTYGIKSSFYKYIASEKDQFISLLQRVFNVDRIIYDERLYYDIHPYRVYVIDLPRIISHYLKKTIYSDIIIAPGYGAVLEPLIALLVSRLHRIPVFIKDTHWYWKNTGLSRIFWYIYYNLIKLYDGVLVPGRASYSFWKRKNIESVYIVHYYWLESKMKECRWIPEKYKRIREENDLIVLYLGRIIRKRGIDVLIKAFNMFSREYRGKAILVLAGKGDYVDEAKKLAIREGIEDRVVFLGPVPEEYKACLYDISDIFVYVPILTDIPEEWPIPPLEAMSRGKPVIVSNIVGSLPDIYPGVVVVKWGSVDDLYNALKKLEDTGERERLGEVARRIAGSITYKRVVYELVKAIHDALARKLK